MKSAEEVMNILEAFDLAGSYRQAAELVGSSKTVKHRAWLASCRFRAVIPAWDETVRPVAARLDATFRSGG